MQGLEGKSLGKGPRWMAATGECASGLWWWVLRRWLQSSGCRYSRGLLIYAVLYIQSFLLLQRICLLSLLWLTCSSISGTQTLVSGTMLNTVHVSLNQPSLLEFLFGEEASYALSTFQILFTVFLDHRLVPSTRSSCELLPQGLCAGFWFCSTALLDLLILQGFLAPRSLLWGLWQKISQKERREARDSPAPPPVPGCFFVGRRNEAMKTTAPAHYLSVLFSCVILDLLSGTTSGLAVAWCLLSLTQGYRSPCRFPKPCFFLFCFVSWIYCIIDKVISEDIV